MRVLQLTHSLAVAYGGPAFNSFGLNRGLNACPDVEAVIIGMRSVRGDRVDATFAVPAAADHGAPTRAIVARRRGLLRELRRADRVIMHGYYAEWLLPVAVLCTLLRIPYVVTPHGALGARQRRYSTGRKRVYEAVAGHVVRSRADAFVVGSDIERAEILEVHPELRVEVGGAGTDVWSGARTAPRSTPLRLVSLSRVAPKKRIDVSIDALGLLRRRGVDAQLDIAGDGDAALLAQLQERAETAGVRDAVRFLGAVHGRRKEDVLLDADMFLLPSEDENFGIAFVEALAHSLPCVVTKAVAAADGLDPRAVAVIDRPDPEDLADAVVRLAASPDFGALRAIAHDEATCRFTWRAVGTHWAALLAS